MIRDPETLNALLDTVNRFVRERLVPAEALVAETDEIPEDLVQEMKDMGLFGLTVPESYGGLELTMEEEVMVMLAMGQTSPCFRSLFGTTVGIGSQGILFDGTPEQKAKYLPKLATGELIASFALVSDHDAKLLSNCHLPVGTVQVALAFAGRSVQIGGCSPVWAMAAAGKARRTAISAAR